MRKLLLVLLLTALPATAAEVLNNDSIIRLVAAGVAPDVIVLKIEKTETAFDTTTDGIIALKNARVPDLVIRAMLMEADREDEPEEAEPAAEAPSAPAAEPVCADVRLYTSTNDGWSWAPSHVCVGSEQVTVDEQEIDLEDLKMQCSLVPNALRGDPQWWFSDDHETFRFQGKPEDLKRLSDALQNVRRGLPRGGCTDRSLRRWLK